LNGNPFNSPQILRNLEVREFERALLTKVLLKAKALQRKSHKGLFKNPTGNENLPLGKFFLKKKFDRLEPQFKRMAIYFNKLPDKNEPSFLRMAKFSFKT